ncbi:MAG TPA: hypothetical protein VHI75_13000, partial [Casimicrobiaceae bacterium]|nr:hypothetical protein [Casimicrobiaceae bacterium]
CSWFLLGTAAARGALCGHFVTSLADGPDVRGNRNPSSISCRQSGVHRETDTVSMRFGVSFFHD